MKRKYSTVTIIIIVIAIIVFILLCRSLFVQKVNNIVLSRDLVKVYESYNVKLDATVYPEGVETKLVWTSSNPSVATVTDEGVVEGIKVGITKIVVSTEDGEISSSCIVSVIKKEIKEISLNMVEININPGEEMQLIATISPDTLKDEKLNWTSSDPSIATVDANGKVTGVSVGIVEIKGELYGLETICMAYIGNKIESLSFKEKEVEIDVGATKKLEVVKNPEDAIEESLTWESSNPSVLEVDNEGNIKAIEEGMATIIVTSEHTQEEAKCFVDVLVANYEIEFKELGKKETRKKGSKLGTLPSMSKDTYNFLGWYTEANGGKKVTENTIVESNMTLYPHWEKQYIIALDNRYNSYNTQVVCNTPTLKYRIIRYGDSDVVLIWVADSAKQLKQGLASPNAKGTASAEQILGGIKKALVAVNGGLFDYDTPHSGVVIHDGKVVKNTGNTVGCMGIGKDGHLKDCTHRSANEVLQLGVLNNFAISHSIIATKGDGTKTTALRTQICQVDVHNFVIVSTTHMKTSDAAKMAYQFSGNVCTTVFNLDGGGSRKLYYRTATSGLTKRFGGTRAITDMLYFVEQ